jgi:hypothetical protein
MKDVGLIVGIGLATAGAGLTVLELSKGARSMEGQHFIMLIVALVAGYVIGRVWATPAQAVGLP